MANDEQRGAGPVTARGTDGRSYTVVAQTLEAETKFLGGAPSENEWRDLRTSDGQSLDYLGRGHYRIARTDIELRSDHPNAP